MTLPTKIRVKSFGDGYSPGDLYVGIDQSYSGFAITILNKDGSYKTTVAKFESAGVIRLAQIQDYLVSTLVDANAVGKIKDIAMEGYAYGREFGVAQSGELGGAVKLALFRMKGLDSNIFPLIVAPSSLKKYITGKGAGVQKNQILLNVYKKWGIEFNDDNAADSYGLAHLVAGLCVHMYEKEVYNKLQAEQRNGLANANL